MRKYGAKRPRDESACTPEIAKKTPHTHTCHPRTHMSWKKRRTEHARARLTPLTRTTPRARPPHTHTWSTPHTGERAERTKRFPSLPLTKS